MLKIRFYNLIVVMMCLLILPIATFAQLPSPTYGWNLGNTMEPPSGVGAWSPAPTQSLINAVAAAGFNTIRIPCAWDSHADQSSYQIDSSYMAQVKQVVDWCYAKGLYVVINDHWDGGWLENNITGTVNSTINAKMNSYWTQIAGAFSGYDSHLLFAAANEPNVSTSAQMSELSTYYQTFVNAVRATGGNNSSRWLVVQGPSTDIDATDSLMNTLPSDSTSGRLMVEVHYYSPYQFCLMTSDASWGNMSYFWGSAYHSSTLTSRNATWGEESYLDAEFQKMYTKFVSNGIPVILGEFGSIRRTSYSDLTGTDLSLHLASRTYFDKYVVSSANSYGLKPIYWDDGGTNNNSMGLFDRSSATLVDSDSARALTGGAALSPPGSAPSAPTGLTATGGNAQIALSWTASSGATSYNVYRSTTSGGEGTTAIATGITSTTYTDTGLANGTTYYYEVAAVNSSGISAQSSEVSAGTNLVTDGTYMIVGIQSGKALEDPGWSTASGTQMDIWTINYGKNQKWILTNLGNNTVKLTNASNGLALEVKNGSTSNGAAVDQAAYSSNNYTYQQWTIVTVSSGVYNLKNVKSGQLLDVVAKKTADGTLVDQWPSNGGTNQQWKFK